MEIVINTFGTYLSKNSDCFLIKNRDKKSEISAKKVSKILITTGATITTSAIKLAIDNNIDIIFLDNFGNPYSRIWHSKLGSTTLIRRRQLEYAMDNRGSELAKKFIQIKFINYIDFLKKLEKYRKENTGFQALISFIQKESKNLEALKGSVDKFRYTLLGIEGSVSNQYFSFISSLLPKKYQFESRSRMPAKDPFNAMLNYGYGILYSMIEKACIIAGLDPYVGFIHTDYYNKKSFVFDIIEMYRIYSDKVTVYQFTQKKIKDAFFDKIKNGYTLNTDGKKFYINEFNKYFEKKIRYKNRNVQIKNIIQLDLHALAQEFLKGLK